MNNFSPVPPFDEQAAKAKVRLIEDAWNEHSLEKVLMLSSPCSIWRNRAEFIKERDQIQSFLQRKWAQELEYRLINELWTFQANRISVRFVYEWCDRDNYWFRSYGSENWEFDDNGLMRIRIAGINDLSISELDRKLSWPLGSVRPDDHPSLAELGL